MIHTVKITYIESPFAIMGHQTSPEYLILSHLEKLYVPIKSIGTYMKDEARFSQSHSRTKHNFSQKQVVSRKVSSPYEYSLEVQSYVMMTSIKADSPLINCLST